MLFPHRKYSSKNCDNELALASIKYVKFTALHQVLYVGNVNGCKLVKDKLNINVSLSFELYMF